MFIVAMIVSFLFRFRNTLWQSLSIANLCQQHLRLIAVSITSLLTNSKLRPRGVTFETLIPDDDGGYDSWILHGYKQNPSTANEEKKTELLSPRPQHFKNERGRDCNGHGDIYLEKSLVSPYCIPRSLHKPKPQWFVPPVLLTCHLPR